MLMQLWLLLQYLIAHSIPIKKITSLFKLLSTTTFAASVWRKRFWSLYNRITSATFYRRITRLVLCEKKKKNLSSYAVNHIDGRWIKIRWSIFQARYIRFLKKVKICIEIRTVWCWSNDQWCVWLCDCIQSKSFMCAQTHLIDWEILYKIIRNIVKFEYLPHHWPKQQTHLA